MATSSFYTDMIIDTPEAMKAFKELFDGDHVFKSDVDGRLREATDEEMRRFMAGVLRRHGYDDRADEIESSHLRRNRGT